MAGPFFLACKTCWSSVISILTWTWNEDNSNKDVEYTHSESLCLDQNFHQKVQLGAT